MIRRLRRFIRRRLVAKLSPGTELADRVELVYRHYLGRAADAGALAYYTVALRDGMSFAHLIRAVETSPEAASRREANEREFSYYVGLVYRHWLGRTPDTNGFLHYTCELRNGVPLSQISSEVEGGPEAHSRRERIDAEFTEQVNLVYQHVLGHAPDRDDLQHYTEELRNGVPLSQISSEVDGSPEAHTRRERIHAEFTEQINLVYQQVMGRAPDKDGLQHYTDELRNGRPLSEISSEIEASQEAHFRRQKIRADLMGQVNLVYHHVLGRAPDKDGLQHHTDELRNGRLLSEISSEIEASQEAHFRRQKIRADLVEQVNLVYHHVLGRAPDEDVLQHYADELWNGAPLSQILSDAQASPEAHLRRQRIEAEFSEQINLVYQHVLGREADAAGLMHYTTELRNGVPLSQIIAEIEVSEEAKSRKFAQGTLGEVSDGEFILNVAELLFEARGATASDIEHYRKILNGNRAKRDDFVRSLLSAHADRQRQSEQFRWDSQNCWIMGTDRYLTPSLWQQRASEIGATLPVPRPPKLRSVGKFEHSEQYIVSAIASLYKGRRFIEKFLDNISSQTMFDRSELIIIDADSPEGEADMIADYQRTYPNIVYKRINYRIGVYDAWNIGVQMARGRYLTNTNLDDLRRNDSFELQANALDQRPSVDVVYQDFFYSFDDSLDFDEVAGFGFKSNVPIVTPNNLIVFNSPHNAPMWRKKLHDELGLFDISFRSAGDWEFWLRCLHKGKTFHKINTPHVVYFQNPDGLSTRADTRGVEEGREVLRRYSRKMLSPHLLMSREEFAELVGTAPDWDAAMSYYDVVQRQLVQLGAERYAECRDGKSMSSDDLFGDAGQEG